VYSGLRLQPPVFEIGLKGYAWGRKALELALAAERISASWKVPIIFDPPYPDIPAIARATQDLLVFAQHMDPVGVGPGAGAVLAESLKEAGAHGTLLNHAEKPMALGDIAKAIERADEVGLATLVCADSPEQAAAIAHLAPNMILAEPPSLIGTGRSVGRQQRDFITRSQELVKEVNPDIMVFNSAGIRTAADVAEVIRLGAEATGSTSGILKADDPIRTMEDMIRAVREAWDESHPEAT